MSPCCIIPWSAWKISWRLCDNHWISTLFQCLWYCYCYLFSIMILLCCFILFVCLFVFSLVCCLFSRLFLLFVFWLVCCLFSHMYVVCFLACLLVSTSTSLNLLMSLIVHTYISDLKFLFILNFLEERLIRSVTHKS